MKSCVIIWQDWLWNFFAVLLPSTRREIVIWSFLGKKSKFPLFWCKIESPVCFFHYRMFCYDVRRLIVTFFSVFLPSNGCRTSLCGPLAKKYQIFHAFSLQNWTFWHCFAVQFSVMRLQDCHWHFCCGNHTHSLSGDHFRVQFGFKKIRF